MVLLNLLAALELVFSFNKMMHLKVKCCEASVLSHRLSVLPSEKVVGFCDVWNASINTHCKKLFENVPQQVLNMSFSPRGTISISILCVSSRHWNPTTTWHLTTRGQQQNLYLLTHARFRNLSTSGRRAIWLRHRQGPITSQSAKFHRRSCTTSTTMAEKDEEVMFKKVRAGLSTFYRDVILEFNLTACLALICLKLVVGLYFKNTF